MSRTKKLTLTALVSALSVVLLSLGTISQVLDLSTAAIVSCFVVFFRVELGGPYPYLFWATTSLCTYLILPTLGGAGLIFALLGLYPLLKAWFERLTPIFEWTLKILLAAGLLALFIYLAKFVFMMPDAIFTGWMLPAFFAAALVAFVLYDIALSRMIVYYALRIRPRIARFLK